MAALLQACIPALPNRTLSLFATTLLHLFPQGKSSAENVTTLIEPLSPQEIRVLKLLVAGLSNGEIATQLVVSANTVKTHVKSIYRKLSINSREEARTIAKELKLF
jgi:LuxR family maltose regulon positive regulatory protein